MWKLVIWAWPIHESLCFFYTYQVAIQDVDQMVLKQALSAPVVAVASPSALRAWINLISKLENWDNSVACIGETTALAAKRLGLKNVYYPTNPGFEGWVDSILEALRVHNKLQKALVCWYGNVHGMKDS